jgi:hypothetical protein
MKTKNRRITKSRSAIIMSWTILLFGESPPGPYGPQDWRPRDMGSPAKVRKKIDAELVGGVCWFRDGWGQYGDDTCQLEFHVGEEDPVNCVLVHVRGLGAVETLLKLARNSSWFLVDDSLTLMTAENQAGAEPT